VSDNSGLIPRATSPAHHALGLGVSVGLHAGLLVLFLFWGHAEAEPERPIITPHTVVNTKLVALGKKRPKNLLPRIKKRKRAKRAPTSLGQEVRKHKDGKAPKKAPKEAEVVEEEPKRSMEDILADFNKDRQDDERGDEDEPEGDPNGSRFGTATSGRLEATYTDKIAAQMRASASYSLVAPDELPKLWARVKIEVRPDGKIADFRVVRHSGNARFDESVTRVLRLFSVDGPRTFDPFPEGAEFGDVLKRTIKFNPGGK